MDLFFSQRDNEIPQLECLKYGTTQAWDYNQGSEGEWSDN